MQSSNIAAMTGISSSLAAVNTDMAKIKTILAQIKEINRQEQCWCSSVEPEELDAIN